METRKFRTILIANRGEIALRIMRACRELGIQPVAVYSDADARSMHVKAADKAIRLGGASAAESYLNSSRIVEAAHLAGADAIHPGYGFLSEDYRFAEACRENGLVFIGPSADSIRVMGLKSSARKAARAAGVSPVPGYDGCDSGDQETASLVDHCIRIGFPVMIKASAGGGGKGMRLAQGRDGLEDAIDSARRESLGAFGDGTLLHREVYRAGTTHRSSDSRR